MVEERFDVTTPEQARFLLHPEYFRILEAVMRGPVSAGAVARARGLKVGQAHYRLQKLCAAGLVRVAHEEKRGGRPIKYYRAEAAHYQIPFYLVSAGNRAELLREMFLPHLRVWSEEQGRQIDAAQSPIHVYLSRDGRIDIAQEWQSGGMGSWGTAHLTPETAAELQTRLCDLMRWLVPQMGEKGPGTRPYTLALLMAQADAYAEPG
ncbi:MarR family transcriptional regulator [Deinococcus lacus]|uniref:MarR family transcriptional regulator n=1 Tax=Deinococcus lacus TaxID=392561 RepID=A0ABW1YCS5_9DEIO